MSDVTSQPGDVVSRILNINKDELKQLSAANVIIKTGADKYNLFGSVSGYINHLRDKNKKAPTQVEIASHLCMSERNVRDVLSAMQIDWTESTLSKIRVAYIRDLREKAAGRGGSQQESLATAKTEEAQVKTALNRLAYHEKLETLVFTDDVGYALNDWAGYANREFRSGTEKIVELIENEHSISINREAVKNIVGPTTERIQGYAEKLGAAFVTRDGAIQSAEEYTDSRVAEQRVPPT